MSTRIMIERKFKSPITSEILQTIDEIRIKALRQRGYIGGETVVNADDDKDVLVISSWAISRISGSSSIAWASSSWPIKLWYSWNRPTV